MPYEETSRIGSSYPNFVNMVMEDIKQIKAEQDLTEVPAEKAIFTHEIGYVVEEIDGVQVYRKSNNNDDAGKIMKIIVHLGKSS
jgi:hypothetical protein